MDNVTQFKNKLSELGVLAEFELNVILHRLPVISSVSDYYDLSVEEDPSQILNEAFSWELTDQGTEFWLEVFNQLPYEVPKIRLLQTSETEHRYENIHGEFIVRTKNNFETWILLLNGTEYKYGESKEQVLETITKIKG